MEGTIRRIAELNDAMRKSMKGGRVFLTAGIVAHGAEFQADVLEKVKGFSEFGPDNDPHGEHDFGRVEVDGQELFWKFDYYDPTLTLHSDDAADPGRTVRVLTIMLAEEY